MIGSATITSFPSRIVVLQLVQTFQPLTFILALAGVRRPAWRAKEAAFNVLSVLSSRFSLRRVRTKRTKRTNSPAAGRDCAFSTYIDVNWAWQVSAPKSDKPASSSLFEFAAIRVLVRSPGGDPIRAYQ